jgi:hypothetical protein
MKKMTADLLNPAFEPSEAQFNVLLRAMSLKAKKRGKAALDDLFLNLSAEVVGRQPSLGTPTIPPK